jgi:hypothetical protein
MKKWTLGFLVLGIALFLGNQTFADDAATTSAAPSSGAAMTGPSTAGQEYEVVDVACYIQKGASGPDHKACAVKCISGGGELALLKGKKLYIPVDSNFHSLRDQFVPQAGEKVQVDGKAVHKGGINYLVINTPAPAGDAASAK